MNSFIKKVKSEKKKKKENLHIFIIKIYSVNGLLLMKQKKIE